jgi:PTH1 family peptidyl-tRNA hydrolase
MKYLIAGLGNIGAEYSKTRHNIGFMVLDELAAQKKATFSTEKLGDKALIKHKGRQIHLIKPSTYMNLSGKAIRYWLNTLKIPRENLLVIVDDLALPIGNLRMRGKGSDGGHNGLKNIQELLGTNQYPRLKFGISNNFPKGKQVEYVLQKFTDEEHTVLKPAIEKSTQMVFSFCTIGIQKTMGHFND